MKFYKLNTHTEIGSRTTALTIYNQSGSIMVNSGSALSANTSWIVSRYAVDDNGKTYYQVATNEYVTFDKTDADVRLVKNLAMKDAVVTIQNPGHEALFRADDQGNTFYVNANTYSNGSAFTTDKIMLVGGNTFYRIATNTWISSGNSFRDNRSGVISNDSNQVHKVVTTTTARVYDDNFNATGSTEGADTGWIVNAIKTGGYNNYYKIATNMWLLDEQVLEVMPYTSIITIDSIAPQIQNFQGTPIDNTTDFGHQVVSKAYVTGKSFNGYLLTDNQIVSIGDASETTLMYGKFLG